MEGVIPNSKVVIIPATGSDDGMWKKELYLRPGEWIIWVTISVVGAMIILAIIVAVLHLNEKVRSAKFRSSRLFLIFHDSGRGKTNLREEGLLIISISTHCNDIHTGLLPNLLFHPCIPLGNYDILWYTIIQLQFTPVSTII